MSAIAVQAETKLITGQELLVMGDIGPCELIDGRIVPMSPTGGEHAYLESYLGSEVEHFVRQRRLGWVLTGEVGIYTRRNPDRVRGADIAFVSRNRLAHKPRHQFLEIAPELVVEIISPNDAWQEVRQKIDEYFSIGVDRVWIVEPESRDILVYRSTTEMGQLRDGDTLVGEGKLEGFELPIADLFAD